jgi:hypothetical protein
VDAWQVLAAAGLAGFGLGLGLLVGAFAVRRLRRFMREELNDDDR